MLAIHAVSPLVMLGTVSAGGVALEINPWGGGGGGGGSRGIPNTKIRQSVLEFSELSRVVTPLPPPPPPHSPVPWIIKGAYPNYL